MSESTTSSSARTTGRRHARGRGGEKKGIPLLCGYDLLALHRKQISYEKFLEKWGRLIEAIAQHFKATRCYVSHDVEDLTQYALCEMVTRLAAWDPSRDPDVKDQTDDEQLASSIARFTYYGWGKSVTQEIKREHRWPKKEQGTRARKAPIVHYPVDFHVLSEYGDGAKQHGKKAFESATVDGTMGMGRGMSMFLQSVLTTQASEVEAIDLDRVVSRLSPTDLAIFETMFSAHAGGRSLSAAARALCGSDDTRVVGISPSGVETRYREILAAINPEAPEVLGLANKKRRSQMQANSQQPPYVRGAILDAYPIIMGRRAPERAKTADLVAELEKQLAGQKFLQQCLSCERQNPPELKTCAFCGAMMPVGGAEAEPAPLDIATIETGTEAKEFVSRSYGTLMEQTWEFGQIVLRIDADELWKRWGYISLAAFFADCGIGRDSVYSMLRVAKKFTREEFFQYDGQWTKLCIVATRDGIERQEMLDMIERGASLRELRAHKKATETNRRQRSGTAETPAEGSDAGHDVDEAEAEGGDEGGEVRAAPPMPEEERRRAEEERARLEDEQRRKDVVEPRAVEIAFIATTQPTELPMLSRSGGGALAREFDPDDCYVEISQGKTEDGRDVVLQVEFMCDEDGTILPKVTRHFRVAPR